MVIAADGQALWTEGAKDRATFGDVVRAKQAGYFDGDPYGMWLEIPMYGDGIIHDWETFLAWLAAIKGAVDFASWLKARYSRWEKRGARSPYAFLDVVLARERWRRADLSQLLGLTEHETSDLLQSFGYLPVDETGDTWDAMLNPNSLRARVRRDQLHIDDED